MTAYVPYGRIGDGFHERRVSSLVIDPTPGMTCASCGCDGMTRPAMYRLVDTATRAPISEPMCGPCYRALTDMQ